MSIHTEATLFLSVYFFSASVCV